MLVSLQKLFVRPQRYQINFRLGFYFYVLYSSQAGTLFSLFKKGLSPGIPFLLLSFCDFFSKEFFSLFNFYLLSIFQSIDQTSYQSLASGLQIFYRRVPKLLIDQEALPKVTGCLTSVSSALSLDCLFFVLRQQRTDLQLKYIWSSNFCTLLKSNKASLLSNLTNISYLGLFTSLNFMDGMFYSSFRGRFLTFLCIFPKMFFNFLFYFTFFNKQKLL
ncbi:MAG: hypothetical protein F9K37_00925 [Bacteroidales bacterium]|nr:MAG: hypothetical protein F9K37_00925 [Bacteroidales bacterium]